MMQGVIKRYRIINIAFFSFFPTYVFALTPLGCRFESDNFFRALIYSVLLLLYFPILALYLGVILGILKRKIIKIIIWILYFIFSLFFLYWTFATYLRPVGTNIFGYILIFIYFAPFISLIFVFLLSKVRSVIKIASTKHVKLILILHCIHFFGFIICGYILNYLLMNYKNVLPYCF